MAGLHPHLVNPLVGNGIAGGIDDQGLVIFVLGGGQQIHRLHNMGMSAHDHIHAHITQPLGDLHLQVRGLQVILLAPVHEHHNGLGTLSLHQLKLGTDLGIEFLQLTIVEGVDHAEGIGMALDGIDGRHAGHAVVGLGGVGSHAHPNAVDLNDLVIRCFRIILGTQALKAGLLQNFQGPANTQHPGVVAMVVAGEQHVKARI